MVHFSDTYLYKLHRLTNALDKLFDQTLLKYTDCGLSQLTLLLAVGQHTKVNQKVLASFLEITPAAISRQVTIAASKGYISIKKPKNNRRSQSIALTPKGQELITAALAVLEERVFQIFNAKDSHTTLLSHIEMLYLNTQEALCDINQHH